VSRLWAACELPVSCLWAACGRGRDEEWIDMPDDEVVGSRPIEGLGAHGAARRALHVRSLP
jgi:hypothetical protein